MIRIIFIPLRIFIIIKMNLRIVNKDFFLVGLLSVCKHTEKNLLRANTILGVGKTFSLTFNAWLVKNEFSLISYLWSPKNFSSICSILNIIVRGYWKYSREMRTNAKYLFVAIIFFLIPPFFLSRSRLHMYSKLKCNDILSTFFCMRIEFAYLKLRMIYIFLYLESFHFSVWPFNIGVAVLMKLSRWNETLNAYVEYYFHR